MQRIAASAWQRGATPRLALTFGFGSALLALYYLVLWPLSVSLSEGPWFTYEYLSGNAALWERVLALYEWLPWLSPWAEPSRELLGGLWLMLCSALFAIYLAAFLVLRWTVRVAGPREQRLTLALALVFPVAMQLVLLLMPGIVTTDVFSYVMYGQIAATYGGNPFVQFPALYPDNPALAWIAPIWHNAPSIYGPLWIDVSWAIDHLTSGWGIVGQVLAYRALVNLAQLANVGLFWLIVRRIEPRAALPLTMLFAWNPLLLFEFSANGHNDALMLTFVLLAVYCCTRRLLAMAIVALALSAMVKFVTLLVLPLFLAYWARRQPTPARQAAAFLGGGALAVLVIVVIYLPWYAGIGTFSALLSWTTNPLYTNSPTDMLANDLARLMNPGGSGVFETLVWLRGVLKWIALTVLAAYLGWETLRVRALRDVLAASARVLLVFLLVANPWVLPWYFSWPLTFGLLAGWGARTARVAFSFSLTVLAVLHFNALWGGASPASTLNVIYLAPLLLPILPRLFLPAAGGSIGPSVLVGVRPSGEQRTVKARAA